MLLGAQSETRPPQAGATPFRLTPDLKFVVTTAGYAAAAAALGQAIASGERVVVLAGAPGTGKTTLLNQLRREGRESTAIAYCAYPALSLTPMLQDFLGGSDTATETELAPEAIAARLAAANAARRLVLIVDDATRSPPRLLVDLCRVAERLAPTTCTLQIVLAANEEFLQTLDRHLMEAGMPPATAAVLRPMTTAETGTYMQHRLAVATLPTDLFTAEAVAEVARHAGGIARAVNQICSRALMLSDWRQERPIPAALIVEAIEDCPIDALVAARVAQDTRSEVGGDPPTPAGIQAPVPQRQQDDGLKGAPDEGLERAPGLPGDESPARSGQPAEESVAAAIEMPPPPSVAVSTREIAPATAKRLEQTHGTPGRASWKLREIVRQRRLAQAGRPQLAHDRHAPRYAGFTARRIPYESAIRPSAPAYPPRKAARWPAALAAAALAAGVLVYQRPDDARFIVDAVVAARQVLARAVEDPRYALDRLLRTIHPARRPVEPARS